MRLWFSIHLPPQLPPLDAAASQDAPLITENKPVRADAGNEEYHQQHNSDDLPGYHHC